MEEAIVEAIVSSSHDKSKEKKAKKRKSSITNPESNNGTDNISSPNRMKGDVTLSPASDAYDQEGAQVSYLPIKESGKAPIIHPGIDGNQNEDQDEKKRKKSGKKKKSNAGSKCDPSDIPSEKESQIGEPKSDSFTSANAEVSGKALGIYPVREAADGNQNEDHNEKKRKKSSKKKKSEAGSNCDPNGISLRKESQIGEPASDTCTRANAKVPTKEGNKARSIRPEREAADGDQNEDQNVKKRKDSRKKKKSNAGSNCDPDDVSLQKESQIGDPTSDTCIRANAEVPRKESYKAPSIHPDREAADGNQNVDQNAKEKKRSSKKKKMEAGSTCDPNGISLEKESHIGKPTRDKCTRTNAEVPRKDCDTAPSIHPDREAADGDQNAKEKKRSRKKKKLEAGSNCDPNVIFSQKESQIGEPTNDTCTRANAEVPRKEDDKASSIYPDRKAADGYQNEDRDARERKRSRKKKKSEFGSNCDPNDISLEKESQIGGPTSDTCATVIAEVVKPQRVENDKSGCAHTDTEVIIGEATGHSNALEDSELAVHDQINESKGKRRKRSRKGNKTTLPAGGDHDKAESTHLDGKTAESTVNSLSSLVGNDNNRCDSALSNDHVSSEQRNGGGPHRKLLILDLNGLLADIRSFRVKGFIPDYTTKKRKIYKRPFVEDFLHFCFDNFDVGIWTSRRRDSMQSILNQLMGVGSEKFLFCLDQSHCTNPGYNITKTKPLFLKELKKVWNAEKGIPVQNGYYNESNTLLVDDSPYKVLRNPPYTAIFPRPYEVFNTRDDSLGPNGELRLYLERLAKAENVQKFVEENPIGQPPITSSDSNWSLYDKVINNVKPPKSQSQPAWKRRRR